MSVKWKILRMTLEDVKTHKAYPACNVGDVCFYLQWYIAVWLYTRKEIKILISFFLEAFLCCVKCLHKYQITSRWLRIPHGLGSSCLKMIWNCEFIKQWVEIAYFIYWELNKVNRLFGDIRMHQLLVLNK